MSVKKRALGRGLDALIVPVEPEPQAQPERQVLEIPLADIRPNVNQPRQRFPEEDIAGLAGSIRERGILQPLLVRKQFGSYELVAGERRLRAAESLGMTSVPCLLVDASDEQSFVLALIENLQRENLNPMEEAKAFQSLIEQFRLTQEDLARRLGKNRSTIANSLRLMTLPLDIQEDVLEGRLSAGHARAILQVPDPAKQRQLRNVILARGLSVRQAEAQARAMTKEKRPAPPKPVSADVQLRSLQEQFSLKLGLPVFIKPLTDQSGKVEIHYTSLDDFQLIADFFGS
jgi:ParB family chromosome partitioning protein